MCRELWKWQKTEVGINFQTASSMDLGNTKKPDRQKGLCLRILDAGRKGCARGSWMLETASLAPRAQDSDSLVSCLGSPLLLCLAQLFPAHPSLFWDALMRGRRFSEEGFMSILLTKGTGANGMNICYMKADRRLFEHQRERKEGLGSGNQKII